MKRGFDRLSLYHHGIGLCFFLVLGLCESVSAQTQWEKTLRAAEAEERFTLYGCCYDFDRILEGFRKKFPKIKVTTVVGSGSQLSNRILAERRADKYIPDAFSGGANTKLVNPQEFKSHWDLLNPKWKGKIASLDPTAGGMGGALQLFYYHPQLGPGFITRLYGEMQITVSRDSRLITDWVSSGKFSLCIRCSAGAAVGKARQQGLPIDFLDTVSWKEGGSSSASGGTLALPNRAPHPNAAKVFINWFLSREGQIALQKFGRPDAHNSRRIDIPKDDVDSYNRLEEGKKYFDLARPEYQDLTVIFKLVKDVMQTKEK